ncbi:TIGR02234 family membrane protein [Streptacidiphilus rugosus]|uniref:TIGR02234 family membrane protein n=1 Tax=Streptacidiphilus rugosus TaxID=405783 RepID=UPI000A7B1833|nr:TIGR02234 family membrane protein [Streptacidiphilus rugosus]
MNAEQSPASVAEQPVAGRQGAAGRPRADRRSLAVTLLLSVLGATLLLVAAGQNWVTGHVRAQGVTRSLSATGGQVTGLPGALALVGLASVVAVFAVRGRFRALLGALVALAGVGAVYAAVAAALGSGSRALDEKAARSVGLADIQATGVAHTLWPWLAAVGGLLLVLAGLLTVAKGRAWPGMSARYDAPTRGAAKPAPRRAGGSAVTQTPADLWKALDRGEDPTAS